MNSSVTRCFICQRLLTDETSVRMGVGSDCRAKMVRSGWKFPKPHFTVQESRTILIGFTGAVEPPKGKVTPATESLIRKIEERLKGNDPNKRTDRYSTR